jgi:hypothetical protein
MPAAAIAATRVDHVCALVEIAPLLTRLVANDREHSGEEEGGSP